MQKQQKEIEKLPGVCRSLHFNLDHPLSLKPPPQELAALDRTLQPGTNPQTGKLGNVALKHAALPQTTAVSLQEPVTVLPVGLETLGCWLLAGGSRCLCRRQKGNPIAQL